MTAPTGLFATLLATGLLGSFGHCIGMCGPLVMMMSLRVAQSSPDGGPVGILPSLLLYHGARIGVYAMLGALVGAVGSLIGLGYDLGTVAAAVSLALGVSVILFGATYLGWFGLPVFLKTGACVTGTMTRLLDPNIRGGVALLGALNGLLPCGLVYSALLVAVSSGSVGSSALGMLLFGLGTIPTLLFLGLGFGALSVKVRQKLVRLAGVLMLIAGLQLVLRSGAALGIVPAAHIGGLVLW